MKLELLKPLSVFSLSLCFAVSALASNGYKDFTWGLSEHAVEKLAPDLKPNVYGVNFSSNAAYDLMIWFRDNVDGNYPFLSITANNGYTSYCSDTLNLDFLFLYDRLVMVTLKDFDDEGLELLKKKYGPIHVQKIYWEPQHVSGEMACWEDTQGRFILWTSIYLQSFDWRVTTVYFLSKQWFQHVRKLAQDRYRRENKEKIKDALSKLD